MSIDQILERYFHRLPVYGYCIQRKSAAHFNNPSESAFLL